MDRKHIIWQLACIHSQLPQVSGKTISSIAFALKHAHDETTCNVIIYVIPYTSIIDPNRKPI